MTETKYVLLAILQSQYDEIVNMDYSKPAPEPNPNANPFEDSGVPLHERFTTERDEIQAKVDYLPIMKS